MIFFTMAYSKLVHDPAVHPYEHVFSPMTHFDKFNCTDSGLEEIIKGNGSYHFTG